jgi:hypothetical protein
MKKVRYLAGAAGLAPVLGLMMPPGNAAATVTHAPTYKGKTVSLPHLKVAHPRNLGDCLSSTRTSSQSPEGILGFMFGTPFHSCIGYVSAALHGGHTQLDMRTRFYNRAGTKIGGDHFNTAYHGSSGWTSWKHTTKVNAWTVCIALVEASANHTRKYGDVCLSTGEL